MPRAMPRKKIKIVIEYIYTYARLYIRLPIPMPTYIYAYLYIYPSIYIYIQNLLLLLVLYYLTNRQTYRLYISVTCYLEKSRPIVSSTTRVFILRKGPSSYSVCIYYNVIGIYNLSTP